MPDAIPHGIEGYRQPYNCKCPICRAAWAAYCKERREARKAKAANETDELAAKRRKRGGTKASRVSQADSVPGPMERAVTDECAALENPAKATQLVAAKQLASLIDQLSANGGGVGAAVINSSTKQLMALMSEIRGDTTKSTATGRRKSGGRLATVGEMTKVKRRGA